MCSHPCRAFTLIELMVATTASLLLILALAQAFTAVSQTISLNRATLEMAGQLRGVALRLRKDLDGVTAPVIPFLPSSANRGYVELHDGPSNDIDADADGTDDKSQNWDTSLGDIDDLAMFTTRSVDQPFEGRAAGLSLQSIDAEVVWWTELVDTDGDGLQDIGERYRLYRRALLIRPDLNGVNGFVARLPDPASGRNAYNSTSQSDMQLLLSDLQDFHSNNDLSVRYVRVENGNQIQILMVANSLADLALRQNRFAHDQLVVVNSATSPPTFAYRPSPATPYDLVTGFNRSWLAAFKRSGSHIGEDVMLVNVLGFDLRLFDATAALSIHAAEDVVWGASGVDDNGDSTQDDVGEFGYPGGDDLTVAPGDLGYGKTVGGSPAKIVEGGYGAFVDMNYIGKYGLSTTLAASSQFSGNGGASAPSTSLTLTAPIYDTWAFDYENDQLDENGSGTADEGVDGLDTQTSSSTAASGGVDDISERETFPPYPFELRGVKISIRITDPDTRQVRQVSVATDFASD